MELACNITEGFKKLIEINEAPHYFIAVSGGVDSMVLLKLFQRQKLPFTVLHVNYQLRGSSSDLDARLVRKTCSNFEIPFHELKHDLARDLEKGGNLQELARDVRYAFFAKHLKTIPGALLCLAHHKNDQEESFWMAMARGGGLSAMAGMKSRHKSYFRPLLEFEKLELRIYAKKNLVSWRKDTSNEKNVYTRNIWRNVFIPKLKINNSKISAAVEVLQKHFSVQSLQDSKRIQKLIPNNNEDFEISPATVAKLNSNEWIELLDQLNIKKSLALQILSLYQGENGKKIILNNTLCAYAAIWKISTGLLFEAKKNETKETPLFSVISCKQLPEVFNKSELYLDGSKIEGTITVRKWKLGDRIYPVGIRGSKLVSDILKDAKVPLHERNNIWLLIDGEKILSLIGYAIDRRAISKKSPCLKISFETHIDQT